MTLTSERRWTTRPTSLTAAGAAAVVLAAGILVAPGAAADTTDSDSTDTTTGASPALPDIREIDGSTGSLLNRGIGTGDQAFCADFGAELEKLGESWAAAVDHVDSAAANTIRLAFTNTEAANFQCLTAADAALTSSGNGSLIGS